jgi:uncharacterized protein (DUF1499 family)
MLNQLGQPRGEAFCSAPSAAAPGRRPLMSTVVPANLGVVNGRLAGCPERANCLCSQSSSPQHHIEPIDLPGSVHDAIPAVQAVIERQPRTKIITATDDYLHAEFTTWLFHVIDDIEFHVDADSRLLHFRSAARTQHIDFGSHRARLEKLRGEIIAALKDH